MRLRIAVVTQAYHPTVGGVTEHVDATARTLRARGHHVTIITSSHGRRSEEEPDVVRVGRNATLPYNGAESNITLGFGLEGALRAIFKRGRYDVVHVHCPISPSLPMLAIRTARVPVVGTFHTVSNTDLPFRLFRPILAPYLARLDRVLAVSEAARADVLRNFQVRIDIVPNGVDLSRFHPGVGPLRRYADGTPNILFVGRFDPRKGLPELLAACERLAARGLEFRLILVGDGRLRSRLERVARGRLRGRVIFEGQVPHAALPQYYAAAHVFCSPARGAESFGLVLLEAMALGVPVVATDLHGHRSVVTQDREGLLVPPRNPGAIAAALERLLHNPDLRARLGRNGLETAQRHGWERVGAELEVIYREILGARAPREEPAPTPLTPAQV